MTKVIYLTSVQDRRDKDLAVDKRLHNSGQLAFRQTLSVYLHQAAVERIDPSSLIGTRSFRCRACFYWRNDTLRSRTGWHCWSLTSNWKCSWETKINQHLHASVALILRVDCMCIDAVFRWIVGDHDAISTLPVKNRLRKSFRFTLENDRSAVVCGYRLICFVVDSKYWFDWWKKFHVKDKNANIWYSQWTSTWNLYLATGGIALSAMQT